MLPEIKENHYVPTLNAIRVFAHGVRVALRCVAMRGSDRQEVTLKRAERLVINVGQFRVVIFLTRFVRPLRMPYALTYTRARAP